MEETPLPFGRYQLLERLAVGGMAELYRARSLAAAGVSKAVVVKKILPAFAGQADFVRMFVNEARVAVTLSHGNIAQVFDFGEVDGEYYRAMEYVRGQPLSKVIRRAHALGLPWIPEEYALFTALEMSKGLQYAHTRSDEAHQPLHIIHRDVSPQNVIIGYEGEVKIVDFGIARARGATDSGLREGAVKGKYPYFSPEQARGDDVDLRTDVYATGVVLYQMCCGRLPHEGKMVQTMQSILRGKFPAPRELNPGLSPELEHIILVAMAASPADRFSTAEAFGQALSEQLHHTRARVSSRALGELMTFLFEPELLADGVQLKHARSIIEQVPTWRRGGRLSAPEATETGQPVSAPTTPDVTAAGPPAPGSRGGGVLPLLLLLGGLAFAESAQALPAPAGRQAAVPTDARGLPGAGDAAPAGTSR